MFKCYYNNVYFYINSVHNHEKSAEDLSHSKSLESHEKNASSEKHDTNQRRSVTTWKNAGNRHSGRYFDPRMQPMYRSTVANPEMLHAMMM